MEGKPWGLSDVTVDSVLGVVARDGGIFKIAKVVVGATGVDLVKHCLDVNDYILHTCTAVVPEPIAL